MIKEPRYLAINTTAFKLIAREHNAETIVSFVDAINTAFLALKKGEAVEVPEASENALLQIALESAIPELEAGYKAYMKRANANPEGKNGTKTGHNRFGCPKA